jgi:CheY-like chemotaxis protein
MSSDLPLPYRVLIVDDVPAVREALRWALENEPDLVVVGEAGTGADALTCATTLAPDLVILDIELPTLDGYAVTRVLKASAHPPWWSFSPCTATPCPASGLTKPAATASPKRAPAGQLSSPKYAARLERKTHEIRRLWRLIIINNPTKSYLKSQSKNISYPRHFCQRPSPNSKGGSDSTIFLSRNLSIV